MDFDIEKTTGSIVIARPLDTRRKSSYNLTVEVTDGFHTIATQVRDLSQELLVWEEMRSELGVWLLKAFD